MFEVRQILTRMRLGDTDRAIARAGLMGRRKLAQLRRTAEAAGWLDVATALPGDPELAVHLGPVRTQPAVASLAEPHRGRIERWWRQGIQGTAIHGALVRSHGFTGSYSSVRRFLARLEAAHPQVTTVLEFEPGETSKTVSVPILDDAIDEGTEYFPLWFSNPQGARLESRYRETQGLIRNADPLQAMWLARFGLAPDACRSAPRPLGHRRRRRPSAGGRHDGACARVRRGGDGASGGRRPVRAAPPRRPLERPRTATMMVPYGRFALTERISAWGLAGTGCNASPSTSTARCRSTTTRISR